MDPDLRAKTRKMRTTSEHLARPDDMSTSCTSTVPVNKVPGNWFRTEDSALVYTASRISCYELSQSLQDDATPILKRDKLQPDQIEEWLQDSRARASESRPSLRILFGACNQLNDSSLNMTSSDFLKIPFSRATFTKVAADFSIPVQYTWALEDSSGQVSRFRRSKELSWSYIFKIGIHATGYYTMNVHYDHTARLTSVLILAQSFFHDMGMVVAMLYDKSYKKLLGHPMLMPFLICTCCSSVQAAKVRVSIGTLNMLEEELGQHTYDTRPKGNILEVDFVTVTSTLNSNTSRLAINEARIRSTISALDHVRDYGKDLAEIDEELDGLQQLLLDHVDHLRDYKENLLLRNDAEQKRTATQLAVVYNFMAQRDNLLNITLAEDSRAIAAASKRDSSAMKSIAAVTMVFLPGTYIAALFAMPLFTWDAPDDESILNNRFWIYWAVTLPLTILVLIIWFSFEPLHGLFLTVRQIYSGKQVTALENDSGIRLRRGVNSMPQGYPLMTGRSTMSTFR